MREACAEGAGKAVELPEAQARGEALGEGEGSADTLPPAREGEAEALVIEAVDVAIKEKEKMDKGWKA